MIKVIHFIHGLNMGGAETLVKDYALLIDKNKFETIVLCLNHENSPYEKMLEESGIKVICLRDRMPLGYKKGLVAKVVNHYELYFEVRKVLRTLKPDILHVHLELNRYVSFCRLPKTTRIFYTNHHTVARWKEEKADVRAMRKLIRTYPTRIIALTQEMKKEIDTLFNVESTTVLNNGIDLSRYEECIDRNKKRKELGVPVNAFVVVHIGRFNPIKNHMFLIDVFEQIKKKKPEAFLLMVGKGDTEKEAWIELNKKHLEKSAMILHDRKDVPEILLASDAALFPSISEGLGIAVIEMQAAGLPCVASTGVPDNACISNKLQFLSLELSAREWARKLLEMCEDTTPIQYSGIEEWDIRHNVKQLEKMYEGED